MALDAIGKTRLKRIFGVIFGTIITICMALLFHPGGLSQQGCLVLAILAGTIVWWICDVLPEFATALIMVALFVLVGDVQASTALVFFSNPIWWLLVGAFSIGLGMKETGLLKRMALAIVSRFPASFAAQVAGFIACGTVLGPLIPSLAAKASLLSPLSMEIGDCLGYKRRGREATGLFLAMLTGVMTVSPAVISGSIVGYTLLALYPANVQAQFDFVSWFLAALPWFIPMTILNFACIVLLYRPRKKDDSSRDGSSPAADSPSGASPMRGSTPSLSELSEADSRAIITAKRRELGKMSSKEARMAAITLVVVLLWVTQSLHGIPAWIPAIGALVAMTACGIVNKANVNSGINWGSLVFIGIVLGLGDVFTEVGLTDWIVEAFSPVLAALAANPYMFIAGIALITIAARFLIVSQTAFLNIFMVFAIPIALALGINPWVIGTASYAVINSWFVKYQNPVYLAAYYSVDGKMAKHANCARYCVLYTAVSIVCLMIAVPFWQAMGLL